MSEKPTFASVVGNRGFRFLWFNQILVQLAYNTLNFALLIWVFKLVDSSFAVAGLMLAVSLPAVIFGLFAGVFVDLMDRRKIIILIDILLALSFLFFIFIKQSYPLILLNAFFVNSLAQFFMPSESSAIPLLVSRKQLIIANSLFSLTLYGAFMIGFSLGGPILNHLGINAIFYLGAAALLLAFILAQTLPTLKTSRVKHSLAGILTLDFLRKILRLTADEGRVTFDFIRGRLPVATAILILSSVQGVIGMIAVMAPAYLEKVLRIHAADSSYFLALPLGTGMIGGAFLIGRLFHNIPRRSIVVPAVLVGGLIFVAAGVAPYVAQFLNSTELPASLTRPRFFFRAPSLSSFFGLLAFLGGFALVSIIVPSQTVLQTHATKQNRGKIFAVLGVVMTSFSIIPILLSGVLSDLFGVTPIFIGLGVIIFITGLIARHPNWFFQKGHLPVRWREFLGLGHWKGQDVS